MSAPVSDVTSIRFQLPGIAQLIESCELMVPMYQRSYSWNVKGDEQIPEYWTDLERAFGQKGEYFLGTVVLSLDGEGSRRTIIDGQQRLATTSLLLAAARDALIKLGSGKAQIVERDFLAKETLKSTGKNRRLQLNIDDDSYFGAIIADGQVGIPDRKLPSQGRIKDAFEYLSARVAEVSATGGEAVLLEWVDFLRDRARIGAIEVPTESDAYVIFETLNDRGADLTTADLLKNYLYGRAGNKLANVKQSWALALGALELTAADAKFMTFLRHYWSSMHGVTREKDLYGEIKKSLTTNVEVADFAKKLADESGLYAAISNPGHEYWQKLGTGPRVDIEVLSRLNLLPNRPLILAAMGRFSNPEMKKLLRALVSWSVRATILGTINSGRVEEQYCIVAEKIRKGTIKTCAAARINLTDVIASDADFKNAFAIARVTKAASARYYLRVLESQKTGQSEPELVPNADENQVNLEHVLPLNAKPTDWTGITSDDDVFTWAYRLGNMVLLKKGANSKFGNKPFAAKRAVLGASDLVLSAEVGNLPDWDPVRIEERQKELSELAVKAWPR